MAKVERFENLECWKAARILVKELFILRGKGKLIHDFDFKSQLRRAALSVMNNIAEGFARYHKKDFIRMLDYAQSSAAEVKSMLYVLEDIQYFETEVLKDLHEKTDLSRKLTLGLINCLDKSINV